MAPAVTATEVQLASDGRSVTFAWSDGTRTSGTAQLLRQRCPCAGCVDEWTHRPLLDPTRVPVDLKILQVQQVGNYALAFVFTDRHTTGIYPWTHLREITSDTADR